MNNGDDKEEFVFIFAQRPYYINVGPQFFRKTRPLTKKKISNENKNEQLAKYRDLVTATLDYYIENSFGGVKTAGFDPIAHFESLKRQTIEHFQKGRLSKLKQWFHDLTEAQREMLDLKFITYIKLKTGDDINIFQSFHTRADKILIKGKITTDNQFNDVRSLVDHLSQVIPNDIDKLERLNSLLADYEKRKPKN